MLNYPKFTSLLDFQFYVANHLLIKVPRNSKKVGAFSAGSDNKIAVFEHLYILNSGLHINILKFGMAYSFVFCPRPHHIFFLDFHNWH